MNTKHSSPGTIHQHGPKPTRPWPMKVGFWLLLGIAAFFLMTEHRAHLVTGLRWLPLLLLLACPLIHVFSHGGHGGHGKRSPEASGDQPPPAPSATDSSESKPTLAHRHGGDLP